jgi:hypothetical protein
VSGLSYNKVCNVEGFWLPELARVIQRELPHEVRRFGEAFPTGHEHRKDWETAMTIKTLEDAGFFDGRRDFLGVAAGTEALNFCLTRHARRVLPPSDTSTPARGNRWHRPRCSSIPAGTGRRRGVLDACWCSRWMPSTCSSRTRPSTEFLSSSIEHFGDYVALHRAMDEIFRVLKPGGIATLSTEYRISGAAPGFPATLMFDAADIDEHIVGNRSWQLLSAFDDTVSEQTLRSEAETVAIVAEQDAQTERDGGWFPFRAECSSYPVIVLRFPDGHVSNTMHLALQKKRRHPVARVLPSKATSVARRVLRGRSG